MGRHGVAVRPDKILAVDPERNSRSKVVAVGDIDEWQEQGRALPRCGDISFISYHDVSEAALEVLQPSTIYSPVLARNFDCIEMALLLQNLGFTGTYRAVGHGLPKPELIEREVRQICPRLTFELLQD